MKIIRKAVRFIVPPVLSIIIISDLPTEQEPMIDHQQLLDALSKVNDPELNRNIVELGMVHDLVISPCR